MAAVATIQQLTPFSQIPAGDSDVALAAAGDRRAFERLYRGHVSRVYSLCARMVTDRTRAEELTQDVFVRAWDKLHLFRGESSFSTWLHRMAVNVVLNARKSDGRMRSKFEETDEELGLDSLPAKSSSMIGAGEMLDIEAAIAKLPPGRGGCSCSMTSKDSNTKRSPSNSALPLEQPRRSCIAPGFY